MRKCSPRKQKKKTTEATKRKISFFSSDSYFEEPMEKQMVSNETEHQESNSSHSNCQTEQIFELSDIFFLNYREWVASRLVFA